jgi:hypothetical protein
LAKRKAPLEGTGWFPNGLGLKFVSNFILIIELIFFTNLDATHFLFYIFSISMQIQWLNKTWNKFWFQAIEKLIYSPLERSWGRGHTTVSSSYSSVSNCFISSSVRDSLTRVSLSLTSVPDIFFSSHWWCFAPLRIDSKYIFRIFFI